MRPQAIFGISVFFAFVVWGIIVFKIFGQHCGADGAPARCDRYFFGHSFRFIGLAFLVPGVDSPDPFTPGYSG